MTRLAFVDCETTGLDPDRHEPYEIALIVREDGRELTWRWWLPVDLTAADPAALQVGRYFERYPDDARDGMAVQWAPDNGGKFEQVKPRDVAESIMHLTAGAHLVGAVPSFDAAFLRRLLLRHGCCPAWHYRLVDVRALAAGLTQQEPPWGSEALSRAVGVNPDDYERHTALGDARWARDVYDAVMAEGRTP